MQSGFNKRITQHSFEIITHNCADIIKIMIQDYLIGPTKMIKIQYQIVLNQLLRNMCEYRAWQNKVQEIKLDIISKYKFENSFEIFQLNVYDRLQCLKHYQTNCRKYHFSGNSSVLILEHKLPRKVELWHVHMNYYSKIWIVSKIDYLPAHYIIGQKKFEWLYKIMHEINKRKRLTDLEDQSQFKRLCEFRL